MMNFICNARDNWICFFIPTTSARLKPRPAKRFSKPINLNLHCV